MKNNGYYKIEESPEGSMIITLYQGCIVDYEILIREIFGSTILKHQDIEVEKPANAWDGKNDLIKVNYTTAIEIKTTQKKRVKKLRAFN